MNPDVDVHTNNEFIGKHSEKPNKKNNLLKSKRILSNEI